MYVKYKILFATIKTNAIARECSELKKASQWAQVEYPKFRKTSVWFISLFYTLIESLISHARISNSVWSNQKQ